MFSFREIENSRGKNKPWWQRNPLTNMKDFRLSNVAYRSRGLPSRIQNLKRMECFSQSKAGGKRKFHKGQMGAGMGRKA